MEFDRARVAPSFPVPVGFSGKPATDSAAALLVNPEVQKAYLGG